MGMRKTQEGKGSYTELWKLRPEGGKGNFLFWVVHLPVLGSVSPLPVLLGLRLWGRSLSSSPRSYLMPGNAGVASSPGPYWAPSDAGVSHGAASWHWGLKGLFFRLHLLIPPFHSSAMASQSVTFDAARSLACIEYGFAWGQILNHPTAGIDSKVLALSWAKAFREPLVCPCFPT